MSTPRWSCRLPLLVFSVSALSIICSSSHDIQRGGHGFWIDDDSFLKDGEPFQILGGDIHYFRIHPEYWEDRLLRMKALGLNTIQTYIPWNLHEPKQGEYHFDCIADVVSFLKLSQRLGFLSMLRVGPYVCAEWDFGGFPSWLLTYQPPLQLRSSDPAFLNLVDKWWEVLLPKVSELLYDNGGPVIMVQVENEFGSYGKDADYLKHLVQQARFHLGEKIILYTTDGGSKSNLDNGTLLGDDVYSAVDFPIDWNAADVFKLQKNYNTKGKAPSLISEFYTGWLTHWNERLAVTSPEGTAVALDNILSLNASAVLYMAHGGTNFGFFSGANGEGSSIFEPDITSYDYDAPIKEAGDVDHAKFTAIKSVLAKYNKVSLPSPPVLPLRKAYGSLKLVKVASLFSVIELVSIPPTGISMQEPATMESLDQISGFILYESILPAHAKSGSQLLISKLHDRAHVFVWRKEDGSYRDPEYVGKMERWSNRDLTLPSTSTPGSKLSILVENMGRINYGHSIFDPKGILSSVLLDGVPILEWTMYPIPLDDLSKLKPFIVEQKTTESSKEMLETQFTRPSSSEVFPDDVAFYAGSLHIDDPADSFISMKGWSKGSVFVNGFNLGRYWTTTGPQCTLYMPAPLLHPGENELLIFEIERPHSDLKVEFVDLPDFTCASLDQIDSYELITCSSNSNLGYGNDN